MNSKPKLVVSDLAQASRGYQRELWLSFFDIEVYNPETTYARGTLLAIDFTEVDTVAAYVDQGFCVVVDHLWDSAVTDPIDVVDNVLTLRAPDWCWIHEYIYNIYYNNNVPRPPDNPTKFFLMPMNLKRHNRDCLLERMQPFLDSSVWSYVEMGRLLPQDTFVPNPNHAGTLTDRRYMPHWYADTCFSMVSETAVNTAHMGFGLPSGHVFVSEKSFKPLSYRHPFIIYGTQNTLSYIKSCGFETFGNIIDESYDSIENEFARLDKITQVVTDLYAEYTAHGTVFQTAQAQAITEHNYNHFWNFDNVKSRFETQIVNPMLEFAAK